ncbi:MAG: tetratricopeptide repeat protein [Deltaproteobacteria bacterium]|nr:tetratricopeptide repeat protein [Deltaproteobacteria bacterium]
MTKKGRKKPQTDESPRQFFIERHSHVILAFILLLALALRVLALLSLKETIYFDFLLYDERLYHQWASRIAEGTFKSSSVYEMAPLPAYLMALVYMLASPDVIYIRIINIIFGVLTCYFIYLIAKKLIDGKAGLIASIIAMLYKPFIFYSIVPLKTSLSVFLFAATCYLLISVMEKTSLLNTLFLGLAVGLANNVRPNCIVLIPLILLLLIWNAYKIKSGLKRASLIIILYIAGLFIVQSPFMARNYFVAGQYSPTTSQTGFHLYMCNNLEYEGLPPFTTTVPSERGIQFTIEASRRVGKKLSPSEASRYWTDEVIRMALEHPVAFAGKQFTKTLRFFNRVDRGDHYDIGFLKNYATYFKLPLLTFWMILPFGMASMLINILRSRKTFALSSVFFVYALTLVIFFSNIRMRLPTLTILIPFAVLGIKQLIQNIGEKRSKKIVVYLVIFLLFLIIEFIPHGRTNDITGYLNTHAIIFDSKGSEDEAIGYWEESSQMEGRYSSFANLSLARKYMSRGNMSKALDYINKIPDDSFAVAPKYDILGDLMMQQGKVEKAVSAYEKALEINSGLRPTRSKLIKILWRTDRDKALEEYEKLEYITSFYNLYGKKRRNIQ